ncbi:MAG: hypothetical protein MPJ02_06150 [Nitrosopumilus sp.]|nr:hypothetical protein [Nitrosopumilus sp.]
MSPYLPALLAVLALAASVPHADGLTVALDRDPYTWIDRVLITVTAPSLNLDGGAVEEMGAETIEIYTLEGRISGYVLRETGPDTGVFAGSVMLTGFNYDAKGTAVTPRGPSGTGPDDGLLPAGDDDGITVSYEGPGGETAVAASYIRWNFGQVEWVGAPYAEGERGTVRVTDPDMDLDRGAADSFAVAVSAGGSEVDVTVTETAASTGVFEGGVALRGIASDGDTVTATYMDATLPLPYLRGDETAIEAGTILGAEAPDVRISGARILTIGGAGLDEVQAGQQIRITADIHNGGTSELPFGYVVTIPGGREGGDAVMWISGVVPASGSLDPSVTWTAPEPGSYEAVIDLRPSVSSREALLPPVRIPFTVVAPEPMPGPIPDPAAGRVSISDARVADTYGNPVTGVNPGEIVQLSATFMNLDSSYLPVTYVAEVTGGAGPETKFASTQLAPRSSATMSISWTPGEAGTYDIRVHARPSASSTEDLAPPVSYSVSVGGATGGGAGGDAIPSTEKSSASAPSVDGEARSGQEVDITGRVTNNLDRSQMQVYIVQITDAEGTVVHISWASEDVAAGGVFVPSVPWVPPGPGTYTVTTFVWSSLSGSPEALAPPSTATITVS